MSILKKLKAFNSMFDIEKKKGYIFKKWIFWIALIFISIPIILYGINYGFDYKPYFNCKNGLCENPFYNRCDLKYCCIDGWCQEEYLYKGEYGERPPNWTFYYPLIIVFTFFMAFIINHFLYNKGYKSKGDVLEKD